MILKGSYTKGSIDYDVLVLKSSAELKVLVGKQGIVVSAFMTDGEAEYCAYTKDAKEISKIIVAASNGCTAKNGKPTICKFGGASVHAFKKLKSEITATMFNKQLVGLMTKNEVFELSIFGESLANQLNTDNIKWVKMTLAEKKVKTKKDENQQEFELMDEEEVIEKQVKIRKLDEIAVEFEKDLTWLNNKHYYIVNDEKVAEQIICALEEWSGVVSLDYETTGLRINMFGKIGSKEKLGIDKWNKENPKERYRVDSLVGTIFCVQENVSYYFPQANRKFKNLYSDVTDPITQNVCEKILSSYTVGEYRNRDDDMAKYIRNNPYSAWGADVIFMERCRKIYEQKSILAHHGSFEWQVTWLYNTVLNLENDTMIMHQLMYKFRTMKYGNRGEPSNLKHLSKVELGVDQLELNEFFVGYKEDDSGKAHGESKGRDRTNSIIDFSWMDYEGTWAYAPADGDLTLQIYMKYKVDLEGKHAEMQYIYGVEMIVASAIGYMQFYGHRIDENKIEATRKGNIIKMAHIENRIRELNNLCSDEETGIYSQLKHYTDIMAENEDKIKNIKQNDSKIGIKELEEEIDACNNKAYDLALKLRTCIDDLGNLSLSAPGQVAELLYGKYNWTLTEDGKKSVGKKVIKQYLKLKDKEGNPLYPEVIDYTEWKKLYTLDTKFFGCLQQFMYPGGFIFSTFGQIAAATGRMSCSRPNAQQYPKVISAIVIPRENCLNIDSDYSQIEYRTLVGMAKEPDLMEKFKDPDTDYHTMMASLMYGVQYALVTKQMRGDAKSFNFGIPYGMGFGSLAILLTGSKGPKEVEMAKEKYELYFKGQPNVRKFFRDIKESAKINQYTKTYFGRTRNYIFTDKDGNFNSAFQAAALRQAGNAVIQGTAADIFKIGVARTFLWMKKNNLLGLVFLINMVHDEMLFEVNSTKVNVVWALASILDCMQLNVPGFPPLYAGAGVAESWAHAKDKPAEIHPLLGYRYMEEAQNGECVMGKPEDVIAWFDKRNYEFRVEKITNYILDPANHGEVLNPVIGALLGLQFDYGAEADFKKKAKENGLSKDEEEELMQRLPVERLKRFIENMGLDADYKWFKSPNDVVAQEVEEDKEYDDGENSDEEGIDVEENQSYQFEVLDENDYAYGVSLEDRIAEYNLIASEKDKILGINIAELPEGIKDDMRNYLYQHGCNKEDPGALEIVFLKTCNQLMRTGVYVKDIDCYEFNKVLRIKSTIYG